MFLVNVFTVYPSPFIEKLGAALSPKGEFEGKTYEFKSSCMLLFSIIAHSYKLLWASNGSGAEKLNAFLTGRSTL